MPANAAKKVKDGMKKFQAALNKITKQEVLVGVPSDKSNRKDKAPMNNAQIAFIQDRGSPANNIPARPFMAPGVKNASATIAAGLKEAARAVLTSQDATSARRGLTKAGLTAEASIKAVITAGISPTLKPGTVAARARARGAKSRRRGEQDYASRIAGGASAAEAQAAAGITPLVNTGQLLNSITHIVKST